MGNPYLTEQVMCTQPFFGFKKCQCDLIYVCMINCLYKTFDDSLVNELSAVQFGLKSLV